MTGNDVLVFAGPIVLAIVVGVIPTVAKKLSLRDARERIKADLELIAALDDTAGKKLLAESVELRLAILSVQSVPWAYQPAYFHGRSRRTAITLVAVCFLLIVVGWTNFLLAEDPGWRWLSLGMAAFGFFVQFWGRSKLGESNQLIRDRLRRDLNEAKPAR
ncbi:hypothetical protein [Rhodococcus sp. IEGM 1330]|uniref:hypothetical protein n=1 Tax=Rhodococcus sp. IEGM 1330 TaxID=3082225 RepID=UPI0029530DCE|nr:hypothetical protein [Rhodococcus sp. IEGM 1330]MDV8022494.1 hypothetical protein [Rhodococcus sp. IEGM 1330]